VPPSFRTADPYRIFTGKDGITWQESTGNSLLSSARKVIETSRAIAEVARELGISETSLGNWVKAYREKHAEDEPPLQLSERARLRELEREVRELRMKADFLSKAAAYFAAEHR
jgi:transposase